VHLAYVAAGRFDAGLLRHTKLWDIAAGLLLAAKAGVVLSGPDGAPTPELTLAAAPALWREFSAAAEAAVAHPI
jgi:fructose-1,6-bisphosphatase/inositol monophosphatase family enzyme